MASSVAARHSETMKKRLKTFAPGRYRTVINIHNPTERKIEIARKFALGIQPGKAHGSVEPRLEHKDDGHLAGAALELEGFDVVR